MLRLTFSEHQYSFSVMLNHYSNFKLANKRAKEHISQSTKLFLINTLVSIARWLELCWLWCSYVAEMYPANSLHAVS